MYYLSNKLLFRISSRKVLLSMFLMLTLSCAQQPSVLLDIDKHLYLENNTSTVILLHGLWRDSTAMNLLEEYLTKKGYKVRNISYPSDEYTTEELSKKYLHPVVNAISDKMPDERLHFVTHSMGGVLVRY